MTKLLKILSYVSIPAVIATGTLIYNAGKKSENTAGENELVLYRLEILTETVNRTENKIDSLQSVKEDLGELKIRISDELDKQDQKLECIVNNMPNKDSLKSQFYDIERKINLKNDMFNLLLQRNELKKKGIQSLTELVLEK